jgi:hypothetical protein
MKKIILLLIIVTFALVNVKAQVYPSAIGLRTSISNYGVGPELSYQNSLGDMNIVETGLGFSTGNKFDRFGLTGAFHWKGEIENGFSWFAGPGVQVWLYSFNAIINNNQLVSNGAAIGGAVGAQIGVEYDFNEDLDLPFAVSLDSRPMFNFVKYYSGFEFALGLSIRYTF